MTNLQIAKLYVAVNGTAPTAAELATLSASATTAADIMAMVDFTGADNTATLNAAYQAAFGRDADAEGLAYWGAELTAGNVTGATLMEKLLVGADVYVSAGDATIAALNTADKGITANKATVALEIATAGLTATEAATALALVTATDTAAASASVAAVVTAAADQAAADAAAAAAVGEIVPFTGLIDTLSGTTGDDIFVGDATNTIAADQINGNAGTDLLKLYDSVVLPEMASIESLYLNSPDADLSIAAKTDITALEVDNMVIAAADRTYTVNANQAITLDSITDTAHTNGVLIGSASTVTAINLTLDGLGDTSTATTTDEVDVEINGTGVTTLNITASTNNSLIDIVNTGGNIANVVIDGDASLRVESTIATVGGLTDKIDASANTGGVTAISGVAAVDFLGGTGNDKFTFTGVVDANIVVTLGAGDDSFVASAAAGNTFSSAATIDGGEGTDILNILDLDDVDTLAENPSLFENFEVLDLAANTASVIDMDLFTTSTIDKVIVSAATAGVIVLTDLADTATVELNAALATGSLTINEKDAGAGSPDDSIDLTVSALTAITTGQIIDFNDIETVNLTTSSTGTNITHIISNLTADEATVVNVTADTANATISEVGTANLVKFDASASTMVVNLTTTDTFAATNGTGFIFGAGKDVVDTSAALINAGTYYQGNGAADTITMDTAGVAETLVFKLQSDSTATEFDTYTTFIDTAEDLIDLKAFGFTGTSDDNITAKTAGVSVDGNGDIAVTEGTAINFFETTGVDYAVAIYDDATNLFVFADVNKDGDFSASEDLVIKLAGNSNTLTVADFIFA